MPLADHFAAEFEKDTPWTSFHGVWINSMSQWLNDGHLPADYQARPFVHLGNLEVDVSTYHRNGSSKASASDSTPSTLGNRDGVITIPVTRTSTEVFEVQIVRRDGSSTLVNALELLSPSNKSNPQDRRAFAVKCAGYLNRGASAVVIDVVTRYRANINKEIVELFDADATPWTSPTSLSAVSYRIDGNAPINLEMLPFALSIGQPLPLVPLWLDCEITVPLDLEMTYAAARKALGLLDT